MSSAFSSAYSTRSTLLMPENGHVIHSESSSDHKGFVEIPFKNHISRFLDRHPHANPASRISSFRRWPSADDRHASISSAGSRYSNMDTIDEQFIVEQFQPRSTIAELDDQRLSGIAPLHSEGQRASFVGEHDQYDTLDIPDMWLNSRKEPRGTSSARRYPGSLMSERKEVGHRTHSSHDERSQSKEHAVRYQRSKTESDSATANKKYGDQRILLNKTESKKETEKRSASDNRYIEQEQSKSILHSPSDESSYLFVPRTLERCTFGSVGPDALIDVNVIKNKQKQHKRSQRRKHKDCFCKVVTLVLFLGTCAIFPYAVVQYVIHKNMLKSLEERVAEGNLTESALDRSADTSLVPIIISEEQRTPATKQNIVLATKPREATFPGNSATTPQTNKPTTV